MNQSDLIAAVATKLGGSNADAKRALDAITETISASLKKGEEVAIAGFGKFSVKAREARQGRNPATGETIQIAASKSAGFSAAKALKDSLNG